MNTVLFCIFMLWGATEVRQLFAPRVTTNSSPPTVHMGHYKYQLAPHGTHGSLQIAACPPRYTWVTTNSSTSTSNDNKRWQINLCWCSSTLSMAALSSSWWPSLSPWCSRCSSTSLSSSFRTVTNSSPLPSSHTPSCDRSAASSSVHRPLYCTIWGRGQRGRIRRRRGRERIKKEEGERGGGQTHLILEFLHKLLAVLVCLQVLGKGVLLLPELKTKPEVLSLQLLVLQLKISHFRL